MSSDRINHRVALAARPDGVPEESDFRIEEETVDELADGEVLVAVEVLSMDAFIRTTLDEGAFHGTVPIGGTVTALGGGRVVESRSDTLSPGDAVVGGLGAQTLAKVPAALVQPVDTSSVPLRTYLGALGMTTGLTAYAGMVFVGAPGPGDTVVVSGAAGAVGSFAGQIAKLSGADKVIGVAGGPEKGAFLVDELGFDASIDYKAGDVGAQLDQLAPDGIDVFFDNVGGDILQAALGNLALRGRVVLCGAIAGYNDTEPRPGPNNLTSLIVQRGRMEGFIIMDYLPRADEAIGDLATWVLGGDLTYAVDVVDGLDNAPLALDRLFTGANHGKVMVRL